MGLDSLRVSRLEDRAILVRYTLLVVVVTGVTLLREEWRKVTAAELVSYTKLFDLEDQESRLALDLPVSLYETDENLLEQLPKVGPKTAQTLFRHRHGITQARCDSIAAATSELAKLPRINNPLSKSLPQYIRPEGCFDRMIPPEPW